MVGVKEQVEKLFDSVLSSPMVGLLDTAPSNLWDQARHILSSALAAGYQLKSKELTGYELSDQELKTLDENLKGMAIQLMKVHTKEAANTVLSRMKDK